MPNSDFNIKDQLKKMRDKKSSAGSALIEDEPTIIDDNSYNIDNDMIISDTPAIENLESIVQDKKPTIKFTPELIDQINKMYDPAADYVYKPGEEPEKDAEEPAIKIKLDVHRIAKDIWKKKSLIIAIMIVIFLITFGLLSVVIKTKYSATAVLLQKTDSEAIGIGDVAHIKIQPYSIGTLSNTIITVATMQKVIAKLNLKISQWQLIGMVKTSTPRQSNTIEITATDVDPLRAAKIVNAIADAALEANMSMYSSEADKYLKYYGEKSNIEKENLTEIQGKILSFSRESNIVNLSVQQEVNLRRLSELEVEYEDTKLELNNLLSEIESTNYLLKHDPEQLLEKLMESNPLKIQLLNLEASLANAKMEYTDKNPKVINLEQQVYSLRKKISTSAFNVSMITMRKKQKDLEIKLSQLKNSRIELNRELLDLPQKEVDYNNMIREKTAIEARYNHFTGMIEEAKLVKDGGLSNFQIASYAMSPESQPKKKFNIIIILASLMSAVFAGFGTAIIIVLISFKVGTKKELEMIYEIPVFLEIEKLSQPQMVDLCSFDDNSYQEIFRKLISHMNKANKKPIHSVFVTSAEEGEGKTTMCLNLVKYLTKRSQNVVYLNLCPNNTVEEYLGVVQTENMIQLNDFLVNNSLFDKLPQPTINQGLSYIRMGDNWDNYLDCLDSHQMQEFLNLLEYQYEFVVIDAPAVLQAPDLPMVQKIADSIVFVVESNLLARGQITQALEALSHVKLKVNGFVLNKMPDEFIS